MPRKPGRRLTFELQDLRPPFGCGRSYHVRARRTYDRRVFRHHVTAGERSASTTTPHRALGNPGSGTLDAALGRRKASSQGILHFSLAQAIHTTRTTRSRASRAVQKLGAGAAHEGQYSVLLGHRDDPLLILAAAPRAGGRHGRNSARQTLPGGAGGAEAAAELLKPSRFRAAAERIRFFDGLENSSIRSSPIDTANLVGVRSITACFAWHELPLLERAGKRFTKRP
jgi:hypothetical protein